MLRLALMHHGHSVVEARNGREGVGLFAGADADIVITDIVMPEMEGIELISEMRRREPRVKIIAISGGGRNSPADYLQLAKMLGASRVLAKPFSNDALITAVSEVLAGPRPTELGAPAI